MAAGLSIPENYFSTHVRILRFFGLWSREDSGPRRSGSPNDFFYLIYRTTFLFTFAYLFTALEIIELFFGWENFDDFISNLCYAIVHIMACSKISLMLIRARDIRAVVNAFESGIFKIRKNGAEKEAWLVKDCVLRTRRLLRIYFIIGTSVVMNGLLCPLYITSDSDTGSEDRSGNCSTFASAETRRKLPYTTYFPFDDDATPNYEVAYAYQGLCMMTLSPIIITIDVLYGSILLHIATQLRILSGKLPCLKSTAVKNLAQRYGAEESTGFVATEKLLTKEIYRTLRRCVLHHCAIIRLTMEMERIFSTLVLLQFLCNLVIMCFPLFQITSVPMTSFPFLSMVSLMTAMMYQLFIFCNCGDEVTHQSSLVADAVYFSDWYNNSSSSEINRAVIMIIGRSRRPLTLTVANFAVLSRETYLKVVKGSASYFMFLRKMRNE